MLFIHDTSCISPQMSFGEADILHLQPDADGRLLAKEPEYKGIPPGVLRRMGKAVRMGVGAAIPLLQRAGIPEGIIIGTAIGGMEDCIKFLNQIIEYDEGILTPGNFVQSTTNAVTAQIGLINKNHGYNITHVHRGLAFEMALLDTMMMAREKPASWWLTGAVDEISSYNYNIERLGGWYKSVVVKNEGLYDSGTAGTLAGEGAAMFLLSGQKENAIAVVRNVETIHTDDVNVVNERWNKFSYENPAELIVSGENGDIRFISYYLNARKSAEQGADIIRFKHLSGEYPTAAAFALWLSCLIIKGQPVPDSLYVFPRKKKSYKSITIYNNYKGQQHSFINISLV